MAGGVDQGLYAGLNLTGKTSHEAFCRDGRDLSRLTVFLTWWQSSERLRAGETPSGRLTF